MGLAEAQYTPRTAQGVLLAYAYFSKAITHAYDAYVWLAIGGRAVTFTSTITCTHTHAAWDAGYGS